MRRTLRILNLPLLWVALATGCASLPSASVTVALAPARTLALPPGGVQTFTVTVTGIPNETVTWTATCGEISGSGSVVTYTAPREAATCTITATSVADPSASDAAIVTVAGATNDLMWLWQHAATGGDVVPADVAIDAMGQVLVTGFMLGDLQGPSHGLADAFVIQLSEAGEERWRRRFGTAGTDWGSAVAVGPEGHVFVTGYVAGDFDGSNAGRVFLIQFEPEGEEVWRRQFGAAPDEYGLGVVADALGNSFVTWTTTGELGDPHERAFVSKFGAAGEELWRRQFDERYPLGAMAVDAEGRVLVTGRTDGGVVVVTFEPEAGDEVGRRFLDLDDVVADAHLRGDGRVYLTGTTALGTMGEFDVHVTVFHADGELAWRRQFGPGGSAGGLAVDVDDAGHVLVVGAVFLGNIDEDGDADAFMVKLGLDGEVLWRRRFGAAEGGRDWAIATAFDPHGAPVVVGGTHGTVVQVAIEAGGIEASFAEGVGTQTFVMKLTH